MFWSFWKRHGVSITSLLIICLGLVVMYGWVFHIPALIQVFPHLTPMRFNTAFLFSLSGILLLLSQRELKTTVYFLGTFIFSFAFLVLLQHIGNFNFGIDQLLFKQPMMAGTSQPGRMSPGAAICFS